MNKKLVSRIDELFSEKLKAKTAFGRNEVYLLFKESISEAILEMLDE